MSRILDYVLEPNVVYTNGAFLIKVKVQDDYKYKKYLVSESMKYITATGTTFTLTNAVSTNNTSILQLQGNTTQNGTPTPSSPIPIYTVSGDNEVLVRGKNLFNKNAIPYKTGQYIGQNGTFSSNNEFSVYKVYLEANTTYTLTNNGASYSPGLCCYNNSDTFLWGFPYSNRQYITFTTPNNTIYALMSAVTLETSARYDLEIMQLEKGSQATTYQAYTGNSYRVDLGGKNKFTGNVTSVSNGSYSEGVVTGTAGNCFVYFNNNTISVKSGETIYFSADIRLTSGSTGGFNALNDGSNVNTKVVYPTLSTTYQRYQTKLTYSSNFTISRLLFQTASLSGSVEIKNIMISKSPDILYSPHVANPIELCKIGSYVDKLKRAEGKNLAEFDTTKDTTKYTYSSYKESDITVNKTATGGSFYASFTLHIPYAGTYAITGNALSSQQLYIYTDNLWGTLKESFTVQAGDFNRGTIFTSAGDYVIGLYGSATGNYGVKNFMCFEGSTALPYEPYGNNWYIEKNIGKVVLNGSESSWVENSATRGLFQVTLTNVYANNNTINVLSNLLMGNTGANIVQGTSYTDNSIATFSSNRLFFRLNSYANNLAGLKTFLSTNNLTAYYVLANPTYEVITNNNLIEQLNNIQDIGLIENLCYVDWVGSIAPTMLLQYPTNETLNAYLITEDNKLIRTDWRFIGRRK